MHRRRALRAPLAVATVLASAACADQVPVAPSLTPGAEPSAQLSRLGGASARYLVGLAPGATQIPAATLAAAGGRVVSRIPKLGVVVLADVHTPSKLAGAGIRYAEPEHEFDAPDATRQAITTPVVVPASAPEQLTAPWYASGIQWNMEVIGAEAGWNASAGAGAKVCIIDSGIDTGHQELAGQVSDATSFVPNSPAPLDSNGHGSHVAGTVAAKGLVTASVAPRARLMTAKVFAATGGTPESRVLEAIVWCTDNGAHVINMSLGGIRYAPPGTTFESNNPGWGAYTAAVAYANGNGTVVVATAGNNNVQQPNPQQSAAPGFIPGVLVVGATGPTSKTYAIDGNPDPTIVTPVTVPVAFAPTWDPTNPAHVWQGPDAKAFYSNFGTAVALFAPGGRGGIPLTFVNRIALVPGGLPGVRTVQGGPYDNIMSVCSSVTAQVGPTNVGGSFGPNGSCAGNAARYIAYAGTSMAAPHVAGAAAVLYAELGGSRSDANRARVVSCLRATADNIGPATTFGGGRLSVVRAVAALKSGSC